VQEILKRLKECNQNEEISLRFKPYEIKNLIKVLEDAERNERQSHGSWEKQVTGNYCYSDTKISKQLMFSLKSIIRQLRKAE
jgi:hypothetical protein